MFKFFLSKETVQAVYSRARIPFETHANVKPKAISRIRDPFQMISRYVFDPRWCWSCGTASAAERATTGTLVVSMGFVDRLGFSNEAPLTSRYVQRSLRNYGHIWDHVETFFRCVLHDRAAPPRRVLVPSGFGRVEAMAELAAMFDAENTSVQRSHEAIICPPQRRCCVAHEVGGRVESRAQLRVGYHPVIGAWSKWRAAQPWMAAMRMAVWRNLGVENEAARTVLFCSSGLRPRNGRRIADEHSVIESLRSYFLTRHPELHFVATQLDTLSIKDEIRLVRRSRVFISLFGSGLHNCRFLPPRALVVEIHGALKSDIGLADFLLYPRLCAQDMGLRWVGYAVNGTSPQSHARAYSEARVDSATMIEVVRLAMDGAWRPVMERYIATLLSGEPGRMERIRAESSWRHLAREGAAAATLPKALLALLQLSQYS